MVHSYTWGFSIVLKNVGSEPWFSFLCFSCIFPATKRLNLSVCFMGLLLIRSLVTFLPCHMIVVGSVEWVNYFLFDLCMEYSEIVFFFFFVVAKLI
jgi:hypothetical protein